jgi:alkylation response protein AidB-like acyl-CoA dehydrogenase
MEHMFETCFDDEARRRAEKGEFLDSAWTTIEEVGLPLALVSEEAGGFGLTPADSSGLLRLAGMQALPVPLLETMLANWMLGTVNLPFRPGVISVAPVSRRGEIRLVHGGGDWRVVASGVCIPWGRRIDGLVALASVEGQAHIVRVQRSQQWKVVEGHNLAGQPRDVVNFEQVIAGAEVAAAPAGFDAEKLLAAGAALSTGVMACAVQALLEMTVAYCGERTQFGRTLAKFQAVQHSLAILAEEAAAAMAAADIAASAFAADIERIRIAAAKARVGEAASRAAMIAHQLHGAIGFTEEHRLHFFTRFLWSCRDEWGSEAHWQLLLGRELLSRGAAAYWPAITSL